MYKCLCDESKPYIFISYAHKDNDKVMEIVQRMTQQGYNIWFDEGIDPGTEWDENIANHVINCSYFIAFVSHNYIESSNCKDELNYSRDLNKEQLLVYLEEVDLPTGMAMRLNRLQAIWWEKYSDNIEEGYNKLFSAKNINIANLNGYQTPNFNDEIKDIGTVKSNTSETVKRKKKTIWIPILIGLVCLFVLIISFCSLGLFIINHTFKNNTNIEEAINYLHGTNNYEYDPQKALTILTVEADKGSEEASFLAGYIYAFTYADTPYENYEQAKEYFDDCDSYLTAKLALEYIYLEKDGLNEPKHHIDSSLTNALENVYVLDDIAYKNIKAECYFIMAKYQEEVEHDYSFAKDCMLNSINEGSLEAYDGLAELYCVSNDYDNYSLAVEYANNALDKGLLKANNTLGLLYLLSSDEFGIKQDTELAINYFETAADNEIYVANTKLGRLYSQEEYPAIVDTKKSIEYFEKAAFDGDPEASLYLGEYYFDGGLNTDYIKAYQYFLAAYNKGSTKAAYYLGYMTRYSYGVDSDIELAYSYFLESTDIAGSLYELGIMHIYGDGIPQDKELGLQYLINASEKCDIHSTFKLIQYYSTGEIVDIDLDVAKSYYNSATKNDNDYAKAIKALCYMSGYCTSVDYDKAEAYANEILLNSTDKEYKSIAKQILKEISEYRN